MPGAKSSELMKYWLAVGRIDLYPKIQCSHLEAQNMNIHHTCLF